MIALAVGTGRSFTNLTDFDPDEDRFVFDVAGLGTDAAGANFVDGGDGTVGGRAASFFKGDTETRNGESVMILTDKGFATGAQAVLEANNEAMGDFVIYFNTTVNVGSLLFVDGARHGAFDRPLRQHRLARRTCRTPTSPPATSSSPEATRDPHAPPGAAGRLARARKTVTKAGVPCILAAAAGQGGVAGGQKWKALPRSS